MKALFKFIEKYGFFLLGFFLVCFIVMVLNGFDLSSFTAFASEANAEATKTVILDNVRYVPKKTDFMALVGESAKDVTPYPVILSVDQDMFSHCVQHIDTFRPYKCISSDLTQEYFVFEEVALDLKRSAYIKIDDVIYDVSNVPVQVENRVETKNFIVLDSDLGPFRDIRYVHRLINRKRPLAEEIVHFLDYYFKKKKCD